MKTISTPELLKFRATDNGFRSLSFQGGFKFLSMVFFLSDNTLKQKQSLGLQEASCPDWKMTTQCGEIAIYSSGQGCGAVQAGLGMATFTTSPTNIRRKIFKFLFLQKKKSNYGISLENIIVERVSYKICYINLKAIPNGTALTGLCSSGGIVGESKYTSHEVPDST